VLIDRLSLDIRPYSSWRKARDTYNSIFDWRGEPNVPDFIAYDWYYCNAGSPYRSQLVMALNAKAVLPRSQGAYVNYAPGSTTIMGIANITDVRITRGDGDDPLFMESDDGQSEIMPTASLTSAPGQGERCSRWISPVGVELRRREVTTQRHAVVSTDQQQPLVPTQRTDYTEPYSVLTGGVEGPVFLTGRLPRRGRLRTQYYQDLELKVKEYKSLSPEEREARYSLEESQQLYLQELRLARWSPENLRVQWYRRGKDELLNPDNVFNVVFYEHRETNNTCVEGSVCIDTGDLMDTCN
jgi:hypothetical protein